MKENIKFNIIKEDFNEYKIENGQILKFKSFPVDISKEQDKDGFFVGVKDFSHVITPIELDTSSLQYSKLSDITDKDEIKELKFTTIKESINVYETEKVFIFICSKIGKVILTNKKDKTGNPILRFTHSFILNTVNKSTLNQQTD